MLHRLAIILIVGFWLAMTGLLVVRELYPESTRLNAVPLGYVGQIVFQHEQASHLLIYTSAKEPGFLHIQPRTVAGSGRRVLEFKGSVNLTLPGSSQQHLSWEGTFEMSRTSAPEMLHLDLWTNEPGQHLDVAVDFAAKKASFGAKVGDHVVNETAFTLDEAGFGKLMSRAGVDPVMLRQLKASQSEMPQFDFSANSSSLVLAGQKLETFLLSMKAGGQTVFDVQFSQLGQVLFAQVPALGWKLRPNTLTR